MEKYTLARESYRELMMFILTELIALNILALLFHLYESPALGTSLLIIIAFNIVITVLFFKIRHLKQDLFNMNLEIQRQQFIEKELQNYRKHRHDMKNHLLVIHELARSGQLEELLDYVDQYGDSALNTSLMSVDTGSEELNILIYSKIESARQRGITFQFTCSAPISVSIQKLPKVISLFANLLDNALEATEAIADPDGRLVSLHMFDDPLEFVAVITNSFVHDQTPDLQRLFQDGYSEKSPDRGRGMAITKNIVRRLEGRMRIDLYEEKFFQVKLELPKHRLV